LLFRAAHPRREPATGTKPPAPTTGPVSYYKDIRRLFQQHCQGCHQPAKPQGGYIMTGYADLFKAGDREKVNILAGKANQSPLVEQITPKKGKVAMPKGKPALKPDEIALVKRWINEGAKDDTPKPARDTISAKTPPVYKLPPVITGIDYSGDGKYLAVSGFHEVLLHKADGSGLVARLVGLSERVQALAFSPDSKHLA